MSNPPESEVPVVYASTFRRKHNVYGWNARALAALDPVLFYLLAMKLACWFYVILEKHRIILKYLVSKWGIFREFDSQAISPNLIKM